MKILTYLKSTMRAATAIFLSLLALSVVIAIAVFTYYSYQRSQAKEYETLKLWTVDLKQNLQFSLNASTKLVGGRLYLMVGTDAYPSYLDDPTLRYKNASATIYLNFADKDNFTVYSKPILLSDFSKNVDASGATVGLSYEGSDYMDIPAYSSLKALHVQWNLDTAAPAASAQPAVAAAPKLLDHCAPNLSKAERLKRLAQYGEVREDGAGSYSVGLRRVTFLTSDNSLFDCH